MKFEIYSTDDYLSGPREGPKPYAKASLEDYPTDNWPTLRRWFVEINTIEDLMEIRKETKHELVIGDSIWCDPLPSIEVYNDYRE